MDLISFTMVIWIGSSRVSPLWCTSGIRGQDLPCSVGSAARTDHDDCAVTAFLSKVLPPCHAGGHGGRQKALISSRGTLNIQPNEVRGSGSDVSSISTSAVTSIHSGWTVRRITGTSASRYGRQGQISMVQAPSTAVHRSWIDSKSKPARSAKSAATGIDTVLSGRVVILRRYADSRPAASS